MSFWSNALQSYAQAGELAGRDVYLQFILFILVPAGIFLAAGLIGESNGRAKSWIKYIGVAWMALGIPWGWPYWQYATDQFNINAIQIGGQSAIAYKVVFIAPILLFLTCLVGCIYVDKKRKEMRAMQ